MAGAKSKGMETMLEEKRVFPPSKEIVKRAYIKSMDEYKKMYKRSLDDPEGFWGEQAQEFIEWYKKWDKVWDWSFKTLDIKWFQGGKLNISYNCLDRQLKKRGDKVALIFQGEPYDDYKTYTYKQLHTEVCKFANVLKKQGVKKGDRVSIYLPMIAELPIAMLACARIGAIHSVVFGGFSAEALRDRMQFLLPVTDTGAAARPSTARPAPTRPWRSARW
jgi:acetyl-CoA synthetase